MFSRCARSVTCLDASWSQGQSVKDPESGVKSATEHSDVGDSRGGGSKKFGSKRGSTRGGLGTTKAGTTGDGAPKSPGRTVPPTEGTASLSPGVIGTKDVELAITPSAPAAGAATTPSPAAPST